MTRNGKSAIISIATGLAVCLFVIGCRPDQTKPTGVSYSNPACKYSGGLVDQWFELGRDSINLDGMGLWTKQTTKNCLEVSVWDDTVMPNLLSFLDRLKIPADAIYFKHTSQPQVARPGGITLSKPGH